MLISAALGMGEENQPPLNAEPIPQLEGFVSQNSGETRSDRTANSADSSTPASAEVEPLEQRENWMGPLRFFKRLGASGSGFSTLARSLLAFTDATRAPFSRKTRLRLSPEALDEVRLGRFPAPSGAAARSREKASDHGAPRVLRLVTWNIERGLQYDKIVQALKEDLPADLYLLQEVDKGARRTERRDVAKSLARELGMYFAFATEFQELIQGRSDQPALHGQAILSRFPISRARVLRFQHQPKNWSRDWFQPRNGGRMALVAEIATPAGALLVYNAHLESRGDDQGRARQMEEIIADVQRLGYHGPLIVAGDLNTGAGLESQVFELAKMHGIDLVPFQTAISPSQAKRQKDWILGANIDWSPAIIEEEISASDHKPLTVLLTLP